jgi:hypothetical protein
LQPVAFYLEHERSKKTLNKTNVSQKRTLESFSSDQSVENKTVQKIFNSVCNRLQNGAAGQKGDEIMTTQICISGEVSLTATSRNSFGTRNIPLVCIDNAGARAKRKFSLLDWLFSSKGEEEFRRIEGEKMTPEIFYMSTGAGGSMRSVIPSWSDSGRKTGNR